jgi:membrane protein YqaA with SNARE-associated domain
VADATALWVLFASRFLAATRLPGGSEAVHAYAASVSSTGLAVLWAAATLGETLTGWVIGRWLAWLPVVGDCFVAGWTGVPFTPAAAHMGSGTGLRYGPILPPLV